jgi:hypothetical protein
MKKVLLRVGVFALVVAVSVVWFRRSHIVRPQVLDDAKAAGKTSADFPEASSHEFDEMDGAEPMDESERKGRNTWLLWTAGDQVFWDGIAQHGFGIADLLKVIDSRRRNSRFVEMGLINQPDFEQATHADEFGLWLDTGPQEAGVNPAVYGRPSGIVGLRIYPNPKFDDAALKRWDPARYYNDPKYYNDPTVVRPYIVGMACGLCHVSFNPDKPPANPERPRWENLSSTIGNQYLNAGRIFGNGATPGSYAYELFHSWTRGTVDTSFLATDNLNNPSKINSIFALPARLATAHEEDIAGGALSLPGEQSRMAVPHVLKDGADSVGLVGAISRVYVSIGEYSQQWLQDHNVIVGGMPQKPFSVAGAQQDSTYWSATAQRVPDLATFLLKMQGPRLQDAPGGSAFLTQDANQLRRGEIVFADNCARCHSSKQPPAGTATTPKQYQDWMRQEVQKPDFLVNNFLSNEERIPVNVVETNAARALATNAMRGHIWDNFSSETYKSLPSVGEIEVQNPIDGSTQNFMMPSGGPGYYRVPSLIGIWATAPLLHNNSVGVYTGDPSVSGRVKAFDDAMTKLLWPEKRRGAASIARTTVESVIEIPASYLPSELRFMTQDGFLRIGPIPAGTPVDLLANADLDLSDQSKLIERIRLIKKVQADLVAIQVKHLNTEQANQILKNLVPDLLKISKCPDFVLDRGHYYGTDLSDQDKYALIGFIKTF